MLKSMPSGKLFFSSAILSRTSLEIWIALEPGRWKIGIATAGWLLSNERRAYWLETQLDPRNVFEARDFTVIA